MTIHPLSFSGMYKGITCRDPGAVLRRAGLAAKQAGVSVKFTRPDPNGMDVVFFNPNARKTRPNDPGVLAAERQFSDDVGSYNEEHYSGKFVNNGDGPTEPELPIDQIDLGRYFAQAPGKKSHSAHKLITFEEAEKLAVASIRQRVLPDDMLALLDPGLADSVRDGSFWKSLE